jgi:hypothetical protein
VLAGALASATTFVSAGSLLAEAATAGVLRRSLLLALGPALGVGLRVRLSLALALVLAL